MPDMNLNRCYNRLDETFAAVIFVHCQCWLREEPVMFVVTYQIYHYYCHQEGKFLNFCYGCCSFSMIGIGPLMIFSLLHLLTLCTLPFLLFLYFSHIFIISTKTRFPQKSNKINREYTNTRYAVLVV